LNPKSRNIKKPWKLIYDLYYWFIGSRIYLGNN
jgi:hypothetical protein